MNYIEKLAQYNRNVKALMDQMIENFKKEFHPTMLELMGDEIIQVKWQQYTPYFNDGEACEFGVYADESCTVKIGDAVYEEVSTWDSFLDKHPNLKERIKVIENFLYDNEEILERALGDHIEVTVTKDGIVTEGYNHD